MASLLIPFGFRLYFYKQLSVSNDITNPALGHSGHNTSWGRADPLAKAGPGRLGLLAAVQDRAPVKVTNTHPIVLGIGGNDGILATQCFSLSRLLMLSLVSPNCVSTQQARAYTRGLTNYRIKWQSTNQLKPRHHFSRLATTFYFSESVRFTDISAKCYGQFLQLWFCSVRSPCITEAIHWSHPLHRAETDLLWKFGVSTCRSGKIILKFSSVTLLQCPCWKLTIYHVFVNILSRYALFWWLVAFC